MQAHCDSAPASSSHPLSPGQLRDASETDGRLPGEGTNNAGALGGSARAAGVGPPTPRFREAYEGLRKPTSASVRASIRRRCTLNGSDARVSSEARARQRVGGLPPSCASTSERHRPAPRCSEGRGGALDSASRPAARSDVVRRPVARRPAEVRTKARSGPANWSSCFGSSASRRSRSCAPPSADSAAFNSNSASIALVAACGWREVGVHRRYRRLDGEWTDVVVVERVLGDAARSWALAEDQRPG